MYSSLAALNLDFARMMAYIMNVAQRLVPTLAKIYTLFTFKRSITPIWRLSVSTHIGAMLQGRLSPGHDF